MSNLAGSSPIAQKEPTMRITNGESNVVLTPSQFISAFNLVRFKICSRLTATHKVANTIHTSVVLVASTALFNLAAKL